MNKVFLIGNLTKDPEVRYTTGEEPTAVCRFTVAVNEGYGEKKKTSYPSVVVFGKQAENCERFLVKGSKVAINGKIQTGSYEGQNGKVYTTDVIADNYNGVEFLNSKQTKPTEEVEW